MAIFTAFRLALAALVAAFAYVLLHYFGHVSVVGISAVGAATVAVPVIATGSIFWGPKGLFYRSKHQRTNPLERLPGAVTGGLVAVGIGLIAFAHFTLSPTVGSIGFLTLVFTLESLLVAREFGSAT